MNDTGRLLLIDLCKLMWAHAVARVFPRLSGRRIRDARTLYYPNPAL